MDRREFLKRAGVGSAALAAFPLLAETAAAHGRNRSVWFLALSRAATTPDGVAHRMIMNGRVHFHAPSRSVRGGGRFLHFNDTPPAPKPILGTGWWRPTRLVELDTIGDYGVFTAGVIRLLVELHPQGADVIQGAKLKVVCNLGPAALVTGRGDEGYTLTLPGGPMGPFRPFGPSGGYPGLGLTIMTNV